MVQAVRILIFLCDTGTGLIYCCPSSIALKSSTVLAKSKEGFLNYEHPRVENPDAYLIY